MLFCRNTATRTRRLAMESPNAPLRRSSPRTVRFLCSAVGVGTWKFTVYCTCKCAFKCTFKGTSNAHSKVHCNVLCNAHFKVHCNVLCYVLYNVPYNVVLMYIASYLQMYFVMYFLCGVKRTLLNLHCTLYCNTCTGCTPTRNPFPGSDCG